MDSYKVVGGKALKGTVKVSGAKNVALKAIVASCLTKEEVNLSNIPLISDVHVMLDIVKELGGSVSLQGHTARIKSEHITTPEISLDAASHIRTSSMFIAPLLTRCRKASIPNPGGCRIGARPIDRIVDGLKQMGAKIDYHSEDGYFYAQAPDGLHGTDYTFEKSTHTGTETLLLAAVCAKGTTTLRNAAEEPEVDDLILLLKTMGARIRRTSTRTIEIVGVESLHGTDFRINPDRNEIVTFAIAAIVTKGDIFVSEARQDDLTEFLETLSSAGGGYEIKKDGIRFFSKGSLLPTNVTTVPYPGFMTDWQGPWAVLMTQADGESIIHETVYESRFEYVKELEKMGANIELFNPVVSDPQSIYNFNIKDDKPTNFHAAKIKGHTNLHNGVLNISDLRAGATLVIAALAASGVSFVHGTAHIRRGYEQFDKRLIKLGAQIEVMKE